MTRWFVLSALIVAGALSLAVVGPAPPAGPTAKAIAATKIEKVKDNLYIITGSGVEDTDCVQRRQHRACSSPTPASRSWTRSSPAYGQTILDRVKTVTNKPITRIINTHTHGDHTGGNDVLRRQRREHRPGKHQSQHGEDGRVQGRQGAVPAEARPTRTS